MKQESRSIGSLITPIKAMIPGVVPKVASKSTKAPDHNSTLTDDHNSVAKMDPNELVEALQRSNSPTRQLNEFDNNSSLTTVAPPEPAASISNNKPGFKYKYPEAAPTPPGEDDAFWNKVYTAADSRFYNRNGKMAEKSKKYRISGETYKLALEMAREKHEKLALEAAGGGPVLKAPKPSITKKAIVKKEPSTDSRDATPGGDHMPMSISEKIKSEGRARKAPSVAPSSSQSTPAPPAALLAAPRIESPIPPPIPLIKPPPKKKGTAALVKKHSKSKPTTDKSLTTAGQASQTVAPKAVQSSDDESNDGGEYCICRGPDDHRMMVNCEGGCDEWYHCSCIGMDVEDAKELLDRYICDRCKTDRIFTTWKRMCRFYNVGAHLKTKACRKAARVTADPPSKYCSDEHARAFFEFVRDHLARQDSAPSMGGRLNIHEIQDVLAYGKTYTGIQALGRKPRLPVPEGRDPTRPVGLDYISPEEEEKLKIITSEIKIIEKRVESSKLQQKLLLMAHERAQIAAKNPVCAGKIPCGYDPRLTFNEDEFRYWLETDEGKNAISTGKLSPATEDTTVIFSRVYPIGEAAPAVSVVPDPLKEICLKAINSCGKHRQWRIIHSQDYSAMQSSLKRELEKLGAKATEIIEDAETREACKEYDAHNTTEPLF